MTNGSFADSLPSRESFSSLFILGVTGYVKTQFAVMINHQYPTNSCCFGAIAEEMTKLPVKIKTFPKNFPSPYNYGDHIELLGKFQLEGKKNFIFGHSIKHNKFIYLFWIDNYMFIVANFQNITLIDEEKMPQKKLSNANHQILTPSTSTAHRRNIKRKHEKTVESKCQLPKKKHQSNRPVKGHEHDELESDPDTD